MDTMSRSRLAAAFACAIVMAPATALAQPPAGLPAVSFDAAPVVRQAQAVDALKAWLVASQRDGKPFPRATDPAPASKVIATAFDRGAISETDNVQVLGRMCQDAVAVLTVYLRQGVPPEAGSASMPMTTALQDKLNANVLAYQPEEALAMDFTLDCSARMGFLYGRSFAQVAPSLKTDPKRQAEVRQLQAVLFNYFRGGVSTVTTADLDQKFKATVMTSLTRNGAAVAGALTKPQRAALMDYIETQSRTPAAAGFAGDLTKLRGVFAEADCANLCAT